MRAAVIVAWRPKGVGDWDGRSDAVGRAVPEVLAFDRTVSPYTGIHMASLLPRHWDITLVHEAVRDVDVEMDVDVVFLSTMDYCAPHARRLAHGFRRRGVRVVVGGLYATLNPQYFDGCADAVVVGEAESIMPTLLRDLEHGRLEPRYVAPTPADLAELPVPRYDLVETVFRCPMSYEVTRGCPFACSFCVLSATRVPYRRRPVAHVVRDIQAVPDSWDWFQRRHVTFWDNNLGADRAYLKALCEAITPLRKGWGTQTSIDTITPESARLMGRSGCRIVYIGLESLSQESLQGARKRHNRVAEYKERIGWLHRHGVLVMSIFLLGLDGDTAAYLRALPDLVDEVGVDIPVFSFAAPIEGTPMAAELKDAGRLLPGDLHHAFDGSALVYRPRDAAPEEVELALYSAMRRAYAHGRLLKRALRRTRDGVVPLVMSVGGNLNYRAYQLAIAERGLRRVKARGAWPGEAPIDFAPVPAPSEA